MRQITLVMVAVLLLGMNCFAQNESAIKSLKDKLAKSDKAIQDPKKEINPKTWMDRGKLLWEIYNVNIQYLHEGMIPLEVSVIFKQPEKILKTEEGGNVLEVYQYSHLSIHFLNGVMRYWEETQKIVDDPLTEAVNAYRKVEELDVKGKNAKKVNEALEMIGFDLQNRFFNEYFQSKFVKAYHTALQRIDVSKMRGVTDTIFYFYAGFAAMDQSNIDSTMWQLAVDNFEKALALGYREIGDNVGQIYDNLFHSYMKTGQPEKALKIAQTGFEKNPNYEQLRYNLINFYLNRNEHAQALQYLEQAVARDPTNPLLHFAHGRTLDQLEKRDEAVEAYKRAIAIDPTFFDAYFNMGVVYFNYAVKLNEICNELPGTKEYNECMVSVNDEFAKSVPILEKALTVKPNDIATMEALKSAYYRLRTRSPEMEQKYEDMSRKLKKD